MLYLRLRRFAFRFCYWKYIVARLQLRSVGGCASDRGEEPIMKQASFASLCAMLAILTACGGRNTDLGPLPQAVFNTSTSQSDLAAFSTLRIREFPIPGPSAVLSNIVSGPDGNFWFGIGSNGDSKIGRITPTGRVTEYPTTAYDAHGLIVGPDRNLWFIGGACFPLHCVPAGIGRITPSGKVTFFATSQCSFIQGLTVGPNDNLWFQFVQARRDGTLCVPPASASLREMTIAGKIDASFDEPNLCCRFDQVASPTAYGPDRNLWLANYDSVVRVTARGATRSFQVSNGSVFGMLTVPGDDSSLWFAENAGIGKITMLGGVTQYSDPNAPNDIAAGPGGVWFTNNFSNAIGRITSTGTITEFAVPKSISPVGITEGPRGSLWFTDGAFKIGTFTP